MYHRINRIQYWKRQLTQQHKKLFKGWVHREQAVSLYFHLKYASRLSIVYLIDGMLLLLLLFFLLSSLVFSSHWTSEMRWCFSSCTRLFLLQLHCTLFCVRKNRWCNGLPFSLFLFASEWDMNRRWKSLSSSFLLLFSYAVSQLLSRQTQQHKS